MEKEDATNDDADRTVATEIADYNEKDDDENNNNHKPKKEEEEEEETSSDESHSDSDDDVSNDNNSNMSGEYKLSEYELLRLRNIERNNKRLAELGMAGGFSASTNHGRQQQTKKKQQRKTKVKGDATKTKSTPIPTRRSTRNRRSVLDAATTITKEGTFAAPNPIQTPNFQTISTAPAESEEEVFMVSPILEYAMGTVDGGGGGGAAAAATTAASTLVDQFGVNEWSSVSHNDIQGLKPIDKRLSPPNGLSAIYSLQFYPRQWNPTNRSNDQNWIVGAGKAGIIALWDCNWSDSSGGGGSSSSTTGEEDSMVDPVLSWKAHSGRWVADVHFLPPATNNTVTDDLRSPPSRLLSAANDGCVCLWDLSTVSVRNGAPKLVCQTSKELHRSGIFTMNVNVTGQQIFISTGSKDKSVAVTTLDAITRGCPPLWVSDYHGAKVGAVAFCGKDTSLLASASDDGSVAIHDFRADGKSNNQIVLEEFIGAHHRPHSVEWNPLAVNELMTAGLDDQIKVFDIRSPNKPLVTYKGHTPIISKHKRIHRPIYYNPCNRPAGNPNDRLFVLSGGENSHALSMFRNQDAQNSVVSVYSRGKLPTDCGDAGCLAVHDERVAATVNGGEVLLLAPQLGGKR